MESYQFHAMKETDLTDVLDIYNDYVINSTATFHINPLDLDEMRSIVSFQNPKYGTYVIMSVDKITGYCILAPFHRREAYDGTAEITVYLKRGLTGQGVGGLAFDYLEALARSRGVHTLIASICAENTASIRLCEKKGSSAAPICGKWEGSSEDCWTSFIIKKCSAIHEHVTFRSGILIWLRMRILPD